MVKVVINFCECRLGSSSDNRMDNSDSGDLCGSVEFWECFCLVGVLDRVI